MMYRNCIVAQSGGPTTVINASLCGVIKAAMESSQIDRIYAASYGIQGLMKGNIIDLTDESIEEVELLKCTPASALGSCRYMLKSYEESREEYERIYHLFEEYKIGYFFYIGGNDSMDTVDKLSSYAEMINSDIRIMGVPKTIDNDLYGTDHTPGFGSAAKYISTCIMEIARDGAVYDKPAINIIEAMGRNAGWLAASSVLAKRDVIGAPDLIYLPEREFSIENFVSDVEKCRRDKKQVTVVVSEGVKDSEGIYIAEYNSGKEVDAFGHIKMGGVAGILGDAIRDTIPGGRVKTIEFNVLQRCAMHFASGTDIEEAYRCGHNAVTYALRGETGKMVILQRTSNEPYMCNTGLMAVSEVANREKKVPLSWITPEGNFVTQEAIDYMLPLVNGEVSIKTEKGLPRYSRISPII
jgi:6-phosphofructokinase 1